MKAMTTAPALGEVWINNRLGHPYFIVGLPLWSDSEDEEVLETWVLMMNILTGKTYVRSLQSFLGINRNRQPRFTKTSDMILDVGQLHNDGVRQTEEAAP